MPGHPEIRQRVEQLRQAGASADDIEKYVRAASSVPDSTITGAPQDESSRAISKPSDSDTSTMGDFLVPIAEGATLGFAPKILGAVEGANTAIHGGSFGEGYKRGNAATRAAGDRFAKAHPVLSPALDLAASIPSVLATGGAGELANLSRSAKIARIVGQGAKYGAIGGVAKAEGGPRDYVSGAIKGATIGTIAAPIVAGLGAGAGNVSTRLGLTDKIASLVGKASPEAASTMGTRGQVNKALTSRQDVLDAVGAKTETPAAQQMARIAATKAKAGELYGAARQDKSILQDPELQTLLSDPQVKQAYNAAAQIREASGDALPRVSAPEHIPEALRKMGTTPEAYARLMKLNQSGGRVPVVTGTDILSPELQGELTSGIAMPDPAVLSQVKRYLYDAAQGKAESPLQINQDQARALMPKVDAIRQKLHDLSPAWKQADTFYAGAKGEEEAFASGYDAFRSANNASGEKLASNSPEAMLKAIEEPRYPNEPADALQARANAFREGVRAAAQEQVRGAPVDKGIRSILGGSTLEPTEKTAQVRSLMFREPAQAQKAEAVLAAKRGQAMQTPPPMNINNIPYPSRHGALRAAITPFTEPDLIGTVRGQGLLAQRLASPQLRQNETNLYQSGTPMTANLARLLGISVGGQLAR